MKPKWTYHDDQEFYSAYQMAMPSLRFPSEAMVDAHVELQRQIQNLLRSKFESLGWVEWPNRRGEGDFSVGDEFGDSNHACLAVYSRRSHSDKVVAAVLEVLSVHEFRDWCVHVACEPELQTLGEFFVHKGAVTALLEKEFTYEWFAPTKLKPWHSWTPEPDE